MGKLILLQALIALTFGYFHSCTAVTPKHYFETALLNCSLMKGFDDYGIKRELDFPPVNAGYYGDKKIPVRREQIIHEKIKLLEPNVQKLREFTPGDDARDLVLLSVELNEYVLRVYRHEYMELAKLYDSGVPEQKIRQLSKAIHDKYARGFKERLNRLLDTSRAYAQRNNISIESEKGVYTLALMPNLISH